MLKFVLIAIGIINGGRFLVKSSPNFSIDFDDIVMNENETVASHDGFERCLENPDPCPTIPGQADADEIRVIPNPITFRFGRVRPVTPPRSNHRRNRGADSFDEVSEQIDEIDEIDGPTKAPNKNSKSFFCCC